MHALVGEDVVLASTQTNVGYVIAGVVVVGFLVFLFINIRKAKPEVGSEVELAPNRKPYHDDEELETKVLDKALRWALLLLVVVGVALPLYWLNEPGRQSGADENYNAIFVGRGEEEFTARCSQCHGPEGVGGVAPYVLTDDAGGFVASVEWRAPALNTVLYRYSYDEVFEILQYGRPFSPMPAWGAAGGGALTDQQLRDIILYLQSVQLDADDVRESVQTELDRSLEAGEFDTEGEALFNLGYESGFAGGAFACGRCHTEGWSFGEAELAGGGWYGPNLTGGLTMRQFPTKAGQIEFVTVGAEKGEEYGQAGLSGDGAMPGFGENPNLVDPPPGIHMEADQVMYSPEQIEAIVDYERSL
jgi:mono/diheme cytochrome c family protein